MDEEYDVIVLGTGKVFFSTLELFFFYFFEPRALAGRAGLCFASARGLLSAAVLSSAKQGEKASIPGRWGVCVF
jgi:hypothetical protein